MAKATGIAVTPYGFRACVRVAGKLYTKRFPPQTPIAAMKRWRDESRRYHATEKYDLPLIFCPTWNAPPRTCYVYAIRAGDHVKIGRSRNVYQRINELQTGHHSALALVGLMIGSESGEAQIHAQFRHLWIRGEWFTLTHELAQFIRSMRLPDGALEPVERPTVRPALLAAFERLRATATQH